MRREQMAALNASTSKRPSLTIRARAVGCARSGGVDLLATLLGRRQAFRSFRPDVKNFGDIIPRPALSSELP
jgi:hypothetical protein